MATRALNHAEASNESQWGLATKGEACLMLGDLITGADYYQRARMMAKTLRECDSMCMQAVAVASRMFGEQGIEVVKKAFGLNGDAHV